MEEMKILRGHRNDLYSIVFTPDGKRFWSSAMDRTIKEWELVTGEMKSTIPFPTSVNSLSMAHDGKKIAFTSTRSGSFDIWIMDVDIKKIKEKLNTP